MADTATDSRPTAFETVDTIPSVTSPEEFAVVNHVRQLFYRAREVRRPLVQQWIKNYQTLNNNLWGTSRSTWQPTPEVPEIKPIVSALVGWMTDQRAQLDIIPSSAPFTPYTQYLEKLATDLNVVLDSTWQIEDYDAEVETVLFDCFTYGAGIFKSCWDNQRHDGLGNAIIKRVDPFTFYPDPEGRDMDSCNYFVEARTVPMQEVERRWPGSFKKLGNQGMHEGVDEAPTLTSENVMGGRPMANPGAISPATTPKYGLPGQSRESVADMPGVTVFECWIRQPRKKEVPHVDDPSTSADDDYGPTLREIDSWRCIVVAGNHVLMDEWAEDMWSHGQHPYDRMVLETTGEFWGKSMVELLTSCQVSINHLLRSIQNNIDLMGNPVLLEDTSANISRQQITNKPGTRIRKSNRGEAKWLEPPQIHPQMSMTLVQFYIGEMERISGLSAIVRGATPTGRNSQGVLDDVQEAAFVRIRLGLRNLERALRKVGNKVASLIVEFYDVPRVVALVGNTGFKSWLALRGSHFYLPTEEGRAPMKFQLLIEAGSSMPTSRSARIAEADTLFAMGALDEEAVLEIHRIPNWQTIATRVREAKAAAGMLGQPPGARQRTQRKS